MSLARPFRQAMFWVALSTVGITGSSFGGWHLYRWAKRWQASSPNYTLSSLLLESDQPAALTPSDFATWLGLSADHPVNLLRFDVQRATARLRAQPILETVRLTKVKPHTLKITYQARHPTAFLGDFTNTVLDGSGAVFPLHPFETPKRLPEVILGLDQMDGLPWERELPAQKLTLALDVLGRLYRLEGKLKRVDVSRSEHPSAGQRELIVVLKQPTQRHFLRLPPTTYEEALTRYSQLCEWLQTTDDPMSQAPELVIDLRLDDLAYLSTGEIR